MIRALIFDFDGLILDTETPDYTAWRDIYEEHNCVLPLDRYLTIIGTSLDDAGFAPAGYLVELVGAELDVAGLEARARLQRLERINAQPVLPGVVEQIEAAERHGLKLAVASSSGRDWVERHLRRVGLLQRFDAVVTGDEVERVKPAPDLFETALAALGVAPQEAIVFEDSAHGVEAATVAGIYTVAVPNTLTRHSDLNGADLQLASLADITLDQLLALAPDGTD